MTDTQQPGHGPFEAATVQPPLSARETVDEMVEAGLLDDVMSKVDEGGLVLTGQGGFLPELVKAVLERGLQAEMTSHLGYDKGDPAGRGSPNSRNGTSAKAVVRARSFG